MKNCKQGLKHDFCIEWLKTGLGERVQSSEWCSDYSVSSVYHHRLRCKKCNFVVDEYEKCQILKSKISNLVYKSNTINKEIIEITASMTNQNREKINNFHLSTDILF
jgi:hypothetical protein